MDSAETIGRSLEAVVERAGDPADAIYARLFAELPDAEARFARDVTGAIKAEMLNMVFDCLTSPEGPYQLHLVRAERVNHDGFGTPNDEFDRLFGVVHETCRELAGEAWTAEYDAAWTAGIARILSGSR
jgi:hypothetical protein